MGVLSCLCALRNLQLVSDKPPQCQAKLAGLHPEITGKSCYLYFHCEENDLLTFNFYAAGG